MKSAIVDKDMLKKLNDVIEMDYDAIEAYDAAIKRLDEESFRAKLREFKADHERHIRDLSTAVKAEGGTPPGSGDFKQYLSKGKVVIADLGGRDSILKAMKSNVEETEDKYAAMVAEQFPAHIKQLLENGLADERRHKSWLHQNVA